MPPRLVPDRALPEVAYLPGTGAPRPPHVLAPVCRPHVAARWREHEPYLWGIDLYNHGFAWEAHEVWELAWAATPADAPERALLGGLIQAAAAAVQARLGRWRGVATLARRARRQLDSAGVLAGLDAPAFGAALAAWAERVVAAETASDPPEIVPA